MDNFYNYDIIKYNLCLSMLIYVYNPSFNDINNIKLCIYSLCKDTNISDDIFNVYRSEKIVNFFENDRGLGSMLCVNEYKKRITLVFKGTDDMIDMFYNIQRMKDYIYPDDTSQIHSGFIRTLLGNDIYEKIINSLFELIETYKDYDIFITGHSLGGALSIIFSYLIFSKTTKLLNIITFGGPRVGDYNFQENYNKIKNINLVKIVNKKDIITSLPVINYYNVGKTIWMREDNIQYYENKLEGLQDSFLFKYSLNDHYLNSYYHALSLNKDKFKN